MPAIVGLLGAYQLLREQGSSPCPRCRVRHDEALEAGARFPPLDTETASTRDGRHPL